MGEIPSAWVTLAGVLLGFIGVLIPALIQARKNLREFKLATAGQLDKHEEALDQALWERSLAEIQHLVQELDKARARANTHAAELAECRSALQDCRFANKHYRQMLDIGEYDE